MLTKRYLLKVHNTIAVMSNVLDPSYFNPDKYENNPSALNIKRWLLEYIDVLSALYFDPIKYYTFLKYDENNNLEYDEFVEEAINQFQMRFYEWNIETIEQKDMNQNYLELRSKKFFDRLANTISNLYPKYKTILKLYNDKKNELINDVSVVETSQQKDSAEGQSNVNDTPQSSGDYSTGSFASSVSSSESSGQSDIRRVRMEQKDTYINLLKEVEDKFNNIMMNFVNEIGFRVSWYEGVEFENE